MLGRSCAVRSLLAAGSVQRPFMGHGRACKRCHNGSVSLFPEREVWRLSQPALLLPEAGIWGLALRSVAGALSGLPTAAKIFMVMVREEVGGSAHAAAVRSRSPRALAAVSGSFSPISTSHALCCISQ
eukprot:COSAG04_NODE_11489_length_706_cov_1.080725_1_plen_127_part_10